jgi:hypothetical protein
MLRRSVPFFAISPFSMFMKVEAKKSAYTSLTVGERGKAMAAAWKALKGPERKKFIAQAQKESYAPRVLKNDVPVTSSAPPVQRVVVSDYNRFVQRKFPKLTGNPRQRFRRIAKLWQERIV